MTEVVLFHHAQGLTSGVVAFADRLRQAGHTVHTPDLYDGHTFTSLDDGMAYAQTTGFDEIIKRGHRAVENLPAQLVYGGFSLGVLPAQSLAQTRHGATGALLLHASVPVSEFSPAWPDHVPVQIHAMEADPFFVEDGGDIDAAREIVNTAEDAELFLYPGDQHLFTDNSLPAWDAAATDLVLQRILAFLNSLKKDSGTH